MVPNRTKHHSWTYMLLEIPFPSEWKKGNAVRIYKKEDMHWKITLECRYLWENFWKITVDQNVQACIENKVILSN